MSDHDGFTEEFLKLLEKKLPRDLRRAQFAYLQAIYYMGLKILERFPDAATGPGPFISDPKAPMPERISGPIGGYAATSGGGQSGGGHINAVIGIGLTVLLLKPPKPRPPKR